MTALHADHEAAELPEPDSSLGAEGHASNDHLRAALQRDLDAGGRGRATFDPIDVLLVCAVRTEENALVERLRAAPIRDSTGVQRLRTHIATVPTPAGPLRIGILRTAGPGGLLTFGDIHRALGDLDPQWVLLVGIAAGRTGTGPLDILVADSVVAVAYQKALTEGREYVPVRFVPNKEVVGRIEEFLHGPHAPRSATLVRGPLISSDTVVRDPAVRDEMLALGPAGIGLEMEAGPVAECVDDKTVRWAVLKAVVDHADGDKDDTHHVSACSLIAGVVYDFLAIGQLRPRGRVRPVTTGALRTKAARLSERSKRRLRSEFVAPPDFDDLLAQLHDDGYLILSGEPGAGSRTLARALLATATAEVLLMEDEVDLLTIDLPDDLEGWGISCLSTGSRPLDHLRDFAERVSSVGGLTVFVLEGGERRPTTSDVRTVAPMDIERLRRAVRVRVAVACPDLTSADLDALMDAADPVIASTSPSTEDLQRLVSVISETVSEVGVGAATTEALRQRTSDDVVDRWVAIEDTRARAWFIASLVLAGTPRRPFSRVADVLEDRIATTGSPERPDPPSSVSDVLEASGLSSDDGGIRASGVVPELALVHLLDEFPHVQDGLFDWMCGVVDAQGGLELEGLDEALCALAADGMSAEVFTVIETWLGQHTSAAVLQADRAVARLIEVLGEQSVQRVVREWILDTGSPARPTAPLLLALETGRTLPDLAARFVWWTGRRIARREGLGPIDRWAVQLIFADEVVGPLALDHVTSQVVRQGTHDAGTVTRAMPGVGRSALEALDLVDLGSTRHRHLFRDRDRRHDLAGALGRLLLSGEHRARTTEVLRRWASRSRDEMPQMVFNAIVHAIPNATPAARPYLKGAMSQVRAGVRDNSWMRG